MRDIPDWLMHGEEWKTWLKSFPLCERLHDRQIFGIGILENKKIGIEESCDGWFKVQLTPEDVRQLAAELLRIADESELMRAGTGTESALSD
jgi:hypothetical protein